MNIQNKLALLSALGGAAIAVTVMLAAAMLGLFPQRLDGAQIRSYLLGHPEVLVEMQVKLEEKDAENTAREQRSALLAINRKAFFDPKIAFLVHRISHQGTRFHCRRAGKPGGA